MQQTSHVCITFQPLLSFLVALRASTIRIVQQMTAQFFAFAEIMQCNRQVTFASPNLCRHCGQQSARHRATHELHRLSTFAVIFALSIPEKSAVMQHGIMKQLSQVSVEKNFITRLFVQKNVCCANFCAEKFLLHKFLCRKIFVAQIFVQKIFIAQIFERKNFCFKSLCKKIFAAQKLCKSFSLLSEKIYLHESLRMLDMPFFIPPSCNIVFATNLLSRSCG